MKNPKGKIARWITELEEYDYEVQYVPGKINMKAAALSRNESATPSIEPSRLDENVYFTNVEVPNLLQQVREAQLSDQLINDGRVKMLNGQQMLKGRLKRVRNWEWKMIS